MNTNLLDVEGAIVMNARRFDGSVVLVNCTVLWRMWFIATGVLCSLVIAGCVTPQSFEKTGGDLNEPKQVVEARAAEPELFASEDLLQLKLLRALSVGERQEWIERRRGDWIRSSAYSYGVTSDAGLLGLEHALTGSRAALKKLAVRYQHNPLPPAVGAFLSPQSMIDFARLQDDLVELASAAIHLHPLWWYPQGCSVYVNGILQPHEQSGLLPQRLAADDVLLVVQWCPPGVVRSVARGRVPFSEKRLFVAYPRSRSVASRALPPSEKRLSQKPSDRDGFVDAVHPKTVGKTESAGKTFRIVSTEPEITLSLGRFSLGTQSKTQKGALDGVVFGFDFSHPLASAFGLTAGMTILRPDGRQKPLSGSRAGGQTSVSLRPGLYGQWGHDLGVATCHLRLGAGILSAHLERNRLSEPFFLGGQASLRPSCSLALLPVVAFGSSPALVWGAHFWHILPPLDGWGAEFLLGVELLL